MAQIRFSYRGKRFSVSEKYWKQIKKRFNPENAKVHGDIFWVCPSC